MRPHPFLRKSCFLLLPATLLGSGTAYQACATAPTSQRQSMIETEVQHFGVGETGIEVVRHHKPGSPLLFFSPHDDENTGVEAALRLIRERGGSLVEFRGQGERLLSFRIKGVLYTFDPNRIFTDEGARKTLQRFGAFTPEALEALRRFATELLSRYGLDRAGMIVTVHNNTEAQYSVLSYAAGGEYASDAQAVHRAPGQDPDDFFFVTTPHLYEHFVRLGFNVVLQDNRSVTDDGSLSVLAGYREIPYINVEARHGHLEEQVRMLEEVYRYEKMENRE